MSNELHVIFGTGPLGKATMRELLKMGRRVKMVNRSGKAEVPSEVEVMKADANDPTQTRQITKGAHAVYFAAQPAYHRWVQEFPALQAGVLEGAIANDAILVSGENTYMYGEVDRPQTEDMPYTATTRKGKVRGQMSQTLLEAHQSGKVRVAIGRASDFYGPEVLGSAVGDRLFYPALVGKKATLGGKLDMLHTYTYIEDFGRGLAVLGTRREALGQVWHIPSAPTISTRQFLEMVYAEAGQKPNYGTMGRGMLMLGGLFIPEAREMIEMLYEFEKPFIVDHSKFTRTFGECVTPHREAIRATLEWFRTHPQQKH
jgi:nucleoside-diphosphate-sugar epimerase